MSGLSERDLLRGIVLCCLTLAAAIACWILTGCAHTPANLTAVRVGIYAGTAVDTATTLHALQDPAMSEANPMMRQIAGNEAAFVVVQAGLAYLVDWLTRRTYASGESGWWVGGVIYSALKTGIGAYNYRVSR